MTTNNSHLRREATPSKFELFLDFVRSRFLSIIFVIAVLLALLAVFGVNIGAPRWLKLALLTFVFLAPYGYVVAKYIVSLLYNPSYIWLVDLDARHLDGSLYRFTADGWRDLDVTAGQLCQLTPHLYTGKNVNLEEMTVKGTWRGTLDDRELLRALTAVYECRNMLEEDAQRGFALETQAFTIIRSATRDAVMRVVQTFESGTLPDEGDGINKAVDKAVSEYDLGSRIDRITDGTEIEESDLEEIEPNDFDPDGDLDDLLDPDEQLIEPEVPADD